MKRRILALLAAVFATVLMTPSGAYAGAQTNDWTRMSSNVDVSDWGRRIAQSSAGGVQQRTFIYWSGSMDVVVSGGVSDTKTDGYCGAIQIRYRISPSPGQWSGWHHRQLQPAVDCSTNGKWVGSHYWLSRYPTKDLQARACHANSSGAILHCEGTWH
ncbi:MULTISPECIES: hypothetical protein [unclassified Streptomyces]|uniref:hypothetical protein n=1 Tax=unclassified Streptomyces TaxID=2593676 RepID=UPI000F701ACF|nr:MULTISPECIES: hypothetical protein [unclassified Streptomyces]AZM62623.1 hypothetical protein DLM49_26620 [Streptomyces sp. WAC 01438]RSM94398.1 hypothetical protein DMA10_18635 [Streptomyces sp. WAC 01420]